LTLSSRQEKGRKECKNGGRNEAEDSRMQNGGRKDMREDEEQGRRTRKEEGGRTTRSTGLGLKLVLRTGISHGLPHFEETKYRIESKFGTSRRDFTRFTTFRGSEVQDWERIWYFVPRIHTFHHVLRGRSTGLGVDLILRAGGCAGSSHVLMCAPFCWTV
jgi:hypothetical protein